MLPSPTSKLTTNPRYSAADAVPAQHGLPAAIVLDLLRAYKLLISPLFTGCCRYYPSCADFTREAVELHGAARGLWLGTRRLLRCHPFGRHGVDPVPR
ncbi:MAG: membrane protein insertion efficiency factor YidD [Acidobacteria bacterium]|nr:membrane protein insertion efficiency factor YidD [Acidobacteriota bacterium]